MQSLAAILIDHLERKFPQYQFEYSVAGTTGAPKYDPKDTIKFYRPHDHHGRIELVLTGREPMVELWGYRPPSAEDSTYCIVRVHRFSLFEPDSLLWVERFVAAGRERFSADLKKPLPSATVECDSGGDEWKTVGDELSDRLPSATVSRG